MLVKGDLIRVPADTILTQNTNAAAFIDRYIYTKTPNIGIFIEYQRNNSSLIYVSNEYWVVKNRDYKYMELVC